jgi:hypothetical protein
MCRRAIQPIPQSFHATRDIDGELCRTFVPAMA